MKTAAQILKEARNQRQLNAESTPESRATYMDLIQQAADKGDYFVEWEGNQIPSGIKNNLLFLGYSISEEKHFEGHYINRIYWD